MKFKELVEALTTSFMSKTMYDPKGRYVEVFENPTRSELKSLPKEVRMIIDVKAKKIYVWDANVLHHVVAGRLNIPYSTLKPHPGYFFMNGDIEGNKIRRVSGAGGDLKELRLIDEDPKHWLHKYIINIYNKGWRRYELP